MSNDGTTKRTPITRSRWLSELCQRADRHIDDLTNSGLAGDRNLARQACLAAEEQAHREERPSVAGEYAQKRVDLNL